MAFDFGPTRSEFFTGGPGLGETAAPREDRDIGTATKVTIVSELDRLLGPLDRIVHRASASLMGYNPIEKLVYGHLLDARNQGMSSGQAFLHLRHQAEQDEGVQGQSLTAAIREEFIQGVTDLRRLSDLEAAFRKLRSQDTLTPQAERLAPVHESSQAVNDALSTLARIRATGDRHALCNFGRSLQEKFEMPSLIDFPELKCESEWDWPIRVLETLGGKGVTALGDAATARKFEG
jgi:hypothetical protein